jgi:hypothetical protein
MCKDPIAFPLTLHDGGPLPDHPFSISGPAPRAVCVESPALLLFSIPFSPLRAFALRNVSGDTSIPVKIVDESRFVVSLVRHHGNDVLSSSTERKMISLFVPWFQAGFAHLPYLPRNWSRKPQATTEVSRSTAFSALWADRWSDSSSSRFANPDRRQIQIPDCSFFFLYASGQTFEAHRRSGFQCLLLGQDRQVFPVAPPGILTDNGAHMAALVSSMVESTHNASPLSSPWRSTMERILRKTSS